MRDALPIDPGRVLAELRELHSLTGSLNGAQRLCWTPTWARARAWMAQKLAEIGAEVHVDAAGNQWGTLAGVSPDALLIGGHIDSVPNGGWLDGSLGLLAGLEVLRGLAAQSPRPATVRLVDWADEEGARFGHGLTGSSAASGTLDVADLADLVDDAGRALPDVLAEHGVELPRMGEARSELTTARAYLELHIEQGPVLEQLGLPMGVVTETFGVERHVVCFTGEAAHAGSTPMDRRRDPLAAASRFILAARAAATDSGAMCTVGRCVTHPGIPTAVAAWCEVVVDLRHVDPTTLEDLLAAACTASDESARHERCTVAWRLLWRIEPLAFDSRLRTLADAAIRDVTGTSHHLPSGPLHDAAEMARARIPTAMLFVQSLGGVSHNKDEDTRPEHLELAVRALAETTQRTITTLVTAASAAQLGKAAR
jgi:beta-ureidopropionase / N-carbamoyl-L-amino-acid hydrolase